MTSVDNFLGNFGTEHVQVDQEMIVKYLQYECRYRKSKYRDAAVKTWGELIKDDYEHFKFLMSTEVSLESNTFLALSTFLHPLDKAFAMACVRRKDTQEGKESINADFLSLTCSHRGRMNMKSWGDIRASDYSYFVWAVANTMGRETRSFNVFYQCLHEKEQALVDSAPKGHVKVPKGLKF
jgi:hypothetical protein